MRRAALQRGRFLAMLIVISVFIACPMGRAEAQEENYYLWLDCYENYVDTDDLRTIWSVIEPNDASLDIECADSLCNNPYPHCDSHYDQGPAWEGCQYMRISYLRDMTICRMAVDPPQDWTITNPSGSGTDYVALRYRGRYWTDNGAQSLQLKMASSDGSPPFYGPIVSHATQCELQVCPWEEYTAYVADWPGLDSVTQVELIIVYDGIPWDLENGRLYIDCVYLVDTPPTSVERTTWGKVKSLYR